MTIEEPNKASDLKRTIEAIHESRVIVGHTLSTVGFQGDPQLLVIDELQFVLRPAAVTLDHGDDLRGNVIPQHRKLLSVQKASPNAAKEQRTFVAPDGSRSVSIQYQRFEFPSLEYLASETPLLKVLIGVSGAEEFRIDDWTLTLYYNGHSERGPVLVLREHHDRNIRMNLADPCDSVPFGVNVSDVKQHGV